MIDKSELMKMAWEKVRNYYITSNAFVIRQALKMPLYTKTSAEEKQELLNKHPELIKRPLRFFLSIAMKHSWEEAKEKISEQIAGEKEIADLNLKMDAKILNENAPRRELIPAGKYDEGDKLSGYIVTGLGRTFRPNSDMFSMGITPDTDYVQYAYFN